MNSVRDEREEKRWQGHKSCIIIEDMLQFIVDLRPGIVIGIAISLVHLDQ